MVNKKTSTVDRIDDFQHAIISTKRFSETQLLKQHCEN
jgi:hypothetical protein